jgi:1-deoxy-D-xylulose-5-phosphate reductoisomerase
MRKITILGSTGSVGQSTIKVLQAQEEQFDVQALTAHSNVDLLAQQAISLKAKHAVIGDENLYSDLKEALSGTEIKVSAGEQAIIKAARIPADWIMAAIVGMAGLKPLMKAIEQGTTVAIANKEPLVSAGPFVLEAVEKYGATLLPIDSEHNAVFQVYEPENQKSIERIILTASGGPFWEMSYDQMQSVSPGQAMAHPNWDMGAKISIDSATMFNKALEVIEAHRLFAVEPNQIEVLIHPQSVVHSMIEYCDGSVLAQMGASDMCTPITNALGYPKRLKTPGDKLDFKTLNKLEFVEPDYERFPSLKMAYDCLGNGLSSCVAMNAANEIAVQAFLDHKIAFLDIHTHVRNILENESCDTLNSLNDVIEYDNFIRTTTESLMEEPLRKKSNL